MFELLLSSSAEPLSMNLPPLTVLIGLIWAILILWIIAQHFQLLSAHQQLFADRSRLRDMARLQVELQDRIILHEEDTRLQNGKHGVTLHSLDTLQREFTEQTSQLLSAQGEAQHLAQSLLHTTSAKSDVENQLQTLKLAHEQALKDKDAQSAQRHQAHLAQTEARLGHLSQHAAELGTDLQQAQAALQMAKNDRAVGLQLAEDLQRKVVQLERTLHEEELRLKDQLTLTQQAANQARQSEQALMQSQARISQLQSELQQAQQAHQQAHQAWQQDKSAWDQQLDQQQSAHKLQLQALQEDHHNALAQGLSRAASEREALENAWMQKMQGLVQLQQKEQARSQNELTGLQEQIQQLSHSRAELEGHLQASKHQRQVVQDRVMDFEKRWTQLSLEQQQAHEMLLNLKSLVAAS
jgi:chromosome segregation ATPase